MNSLLHYWNSHGTKLLGILTAIVGAAGESLALIQAFDPKRAALWAFVITLAGGIIKRGFTNTAAITATTTDALKALQAAIPPEIPHEPPAPPRHDVPPAAPVSLPDTGIRAGKLPSG